MATGLRNSGSTNPPRSVVAYDKYVDQQLTKVMSYVRLSDLATGLLGIGTFVVGTLFTLALIDHWVFDLGWWGRTASFLVLVVGVVYGVLRLVVPFITRRVNPAYAARVIEEGEPELKNSLLNYIFLRPQKQQLREIVYSAVEQQAATKLSHVDVDATIDHTPAIHTGIALAGLVVAFGLYFILSPKDPFQTATRVVVPWSDTPRPARVRINNVIPGDTEIYAGRQLSISAQVENLSEGDEVQLVYDSLDGQIVDRRAKMTGPDPGQAFSVTVPPGPDGFFQDISYRIRAGDAEAGPFRVKVKETPSINVKEVVYSFPPYTGRPKESQVGDGNVRAIEGTRVTIRAVANQPIEFAYLEFDPEEKSTDPEAGRPARSTRETIKMRHDGTSAVVQFTLLLDQEGKAGWHDRYRLRFTNADNETNQEPIVYHLHVIPDLAPQIDILKPNRQQVLVAENETQPIELRAFDPDFGLTAVELIFVKSGNEIANLSLLDVPETAPVLRQYDLQPNRLGLRAGDSAMFWAVARDNHTDPLTRSPAPHESVTMKYELRVLPPRPSNDGNAENRADSPENSGSPDQPTSQTGDGGADPRQGSESSDGGDGNAGGDPQAGTEQQPQAGQPQDGQPQQTQNGDGESSPSQPGPGDSGSQDGNPPDNTPAGSDSAGSDSAESQDDRSGVGSEEPSGGSEQPEDANRSQSSASEANGQSNRTGTGGPVGQEAGETSGEMPQNGQSTGQPGQGGPQAEDIPPQGGGESAGDASGNQPGTAPRANDRLDPGAQKHDPLSNDGARDTDAMKRILDRIKEREGRTPDDSGRAADQQPASPTSETRGPVDEKSPGGAPGDQPGAEQRDGAPPQDPNAATSANNTPRNPSHPAAAGDASQTSKAGEPAPADQGARAPDEPDSHAGEPGPSEAGPDDAEPSDAGPEDAGPSDGASDGASDSTRRPGEGASQPDGAPTDRSNPAGGPSQDAQSGSTRPADASSSDRESFNQGSSSDEGQRGSDGSESSAKSSSQTGEGSATSGQGRGDSQTDSQTPESPPSGEATDAGGGTSAGSGASAGEAEDTGPGDEANLDYAKRATDLVLDYLKHEPNREDRELLDRLGWSREDMREFMKRWEQLKQDARRDDAVGEMSRQELDDALKSLGLAPSDNRSRRGGTRADRIDGVRNAGRNTSAPSKYRDQWREFQRSISGMK